MKTLNYEEFLAVIAETNAETSRQIAESSRKIAESNVVSNAERDKRIAESNAERDLVLAETSRKLAEVGKFLEDSSLKAGKRMKELDKKIGEITDTLGRFAEEQVRPRILEVFRAKGIELEETYPRMQGKKDGRVIVEVDLLLVNTIYSVAVEVKNTLRFDDIDNHIARMKKLQETPIKVVKGTTMFGAVAGMIMTDEVEKYAIKKGFYVIKPKGDTVEITNSDRFKPKEWVVQNP